MWVARLLRPMRAQRYETGLQALSFEVPTLQAENSIAVIPDKKTYHFLVLGSGGREHALAWRISKSPVCGRLSLVPGNPGMDELGDRLTIGITDFDALAQYCLDQLVDVLVVGPEQPLVEGIADYCASRPYLSKIAVIGPDKAGAALEGSKDVAKSFMKRHGIPTAASETFVKGQEDEAVAYIMKQSLPIVVKADGLAAGKGVVIAQSYEEGEATIREMLSGAAFGEAGERVVIEQFLDGIELSYFLLSTAKSLSGN